MIAGKRPSANAPSTPGPVDVERQPDAVPHGDHDVQRDDDAVPVVYAGITGSTMWDGWSASAYTAWWATTWCVCRPIGSPVFGLTSSRGQFDDETSTRIRWPTSKRLLVGGSSIVTGIDLARRHQHLAVEPLAVAAADHRVVDEHVEALGVVLVRRVHVDDLRGEVGVDRARGDPQVHLHPPGHLDRLGQRLGLEDEHVGPLARGAGRAPPSRRSAGASFWSTGPGVSRSRSRSTGLRKRAHACSIPAPVGGQLADRAVEAAEGRHRDARGRT